MSIFLDLEAGMNAVQDIESSSENEGSFIADKEYSDDEADLEAVNLSSVPLTQEQDQIWNSLLERAKVCGNLRESTLVSEGSYDFRLLDDAPKLWVLSCIPGWKDIVVFHIGRSAPSELGIKAAFIMPHLDNQVWLEAEMSLALKTWLVQLHAVAPEESWRVLQSASSLLPMVNGAWVKVHCGQFKGKVGMVTKVYPWGCKVLLVPKLDTDPWQELKNKR
ncbi:hypothetical protein ARMSODRAFT_982942 [Armillaria solidipes]|uniref:KOW domain-containing protein n=1 Tax=Armillaria solidipes TaxID=1076256 RepID=A0A2H3AS12_9AGAR|nr:hypothetical protein ARMSODRAFT_982942 [Armillaria solidipes]